jgi:5-methylcytosine-specific restriction endonuclease McrA
MENITDEEFVEICKNSTSMRSACTKLGMSFTTFKRKAIKLNCYKTNQSGKGLNKKPPKKFDLKSILNGDYPDYQSNKLRKRLIDEKIKTESCECCSLSEWLNKPIKLELHHIDGNKKNNFLDNLMLLCPNCHSFTDTYRGKNIGLRK